MIVHGFLFWSYVLGAFCGRLTGVPIVVASRRSLGNYKAHKPIYLALERLANRFTDLVIANSEAVRRDVLEQERLAPQKVIVLHNAVTAPRQDATRPPGVIRESLGVAGDALVVAVLANLIHYKGHTVFVQAWKLVIKEIPHAVALLIGDGPMRSALEQLVDELGVRESVRFLGRRSDVGDLLGTVDLLVHPSMEEGFSNAILEGMAAGLPIVATAVGGNAEAVTDGVTGILIRPGDPVALAGAVVGLLEDHDARVEFGSAGRLRVTERHDVATVVRRYEIVYDHLLAHNSSLATSPARNDVRR